MALRPYMSWERTGSTSSPRRSLQSSTRTTSGRTVAMSSATRSQDTRDTCDAPSMYTDAPPPDASLAGTCTALECVCVCIYDRLSV